MLYLLEEIFPLIRCRWPPSSGDALRRTSKLGRGTFPILFKNCPHDFPALHGLGRESGLGDAIKVIGEVNGVSSRVRA